MSRQRVEFARGCDIEVWHRDQPAGRCHSISADGGPASARAEDDAEVVPPRDRRMTPSWISRLKYTTPAASETGASLVLLLVIVLVIALVEHEHDYEHEKPSIDCASGIGANRVRHRT